MFSLSYGNLLSIHSESLLYLGSNFSSMFLPLCPMSPCLYTVSIITLCCRLSPDKESYVFLMRLGHRARLNVLSLSPQLIKVYDPRYGY